MSELVSGRMPRDRRPPQAGLASYGLNGGRTDASKQSRGQALLGGGKWTP